jgi:hypothetical protein
MLFFETRKNHRIFYIWYAQTVKANAKIRGEVRKIILRWIFTKWDVGAWTELSSLRIGTDAGHL